MRITVAVPEQHTAIANQLAMALGLSYADERTYSQLKYTDGENLYAVASFIATPSLVERAETALERPLWDEEEERIDMTQAEQAKRLVAFDAVAGLDVISAVIGDDALASIEFMGLSRYNPEPKIEEITEEYDYEAVI
jgi:hypothetical protein